MSRLDCLELPYDPQTLCGDALSVSQCVTSSSSPPQRGRGALPDARPHPAEDHGRGQGLSRQAGGRGLQLQLDRPAAAQRRTLVPQGAPVNSASAFLLLILVIFSVLFVM